MRKTNRITVINILSTFLLRGISIVTAPVFSRLLGTDGYGIVSTYTIWVSILAMLGPLQSYTTIPNARIEYPEEEQEQYQSSILCMSMMLYLAVSMVLICLSPWIAEKLDIGFSMLIMLLVNAFGSFAVSFLTCKYTYELKAGRNMLLSVSTTLLVLAISLVLVLILPEEVNYFGRIMGNSFVYGAMGVFTVILVIGRGRTFVNLKYWRFCIVLTLPLTLQGLSDLLLGHFDLVMINQMMGDSEAGMYSLSYNFAGLMFAIFCALNNSWTAFFFEQMRLKNHDNVQQQAKNYAELYTVLSMGFILLATEVYQIFASKEFWPGIQLIPLFVAGYYLNFLCTFPFNYEYYIKKTDVVAGATASASIINIGTNYLMIPMFGMMGAAAASAIARVCQFLLHSLYVYTMPEKQNYPFGIRIWGGYALAFFLCVALVYLLPSQWLIRWSLGAALGIWELWRIKKRKALI